MFLMKFYKRTRRCGCKKWLISLVFIYITSFLGMSLHGNKRYIHNSAEHSAPNMIFGTNESYTMNAVEKEENTIQVITEETGPVMVIILTYQRSGSTFFGEMFNENSKAFYAFEPLDGLYTAMFGTTQGFNSPSDIVQYWDGRRRELPEYEVKSSAAAIGNLLTCQHSELPTEMLLHIFWLGFQREHKALSDYISCLNETQTSRATESCKKMSFRKNCKVWFGQRGSNQEFCNKNLWNNTQPLQPGYQKNGEFASYRHCVEEKRQKAEKCFPMLTEPCERADIRAAKVVRMSMNAVRELLPIYNQSLKVIHLIRDPKAVALSRMKYESVRGHSAGKNHIKEAENLCKTMHNDILIRKELEKMYPKSFHQVIYDNFITEPVLSIENIYKFLGKPTPQNVLDYFVSNTSLNNTKRVTHHNRTKMDNINLLCSDVYRLMND